VRDANSNPGASPHRGRGSLIAAALLLAALGLVVIYTSRWAFMSPVALVVIAAIGVAALLLQFRLRSDLLSDSAASSDRPAYSRGPMWLNVLGVVFALAALFADVLHLSPAFLLIDALAAVVSFAASGIILVGKLRKHRT
jgi:hypothetical protein